MLEEELLLDRVDLERVDLERELERDVPRRVPLERELCAEREPCDVLRRGGVLRPDRAPSYAPLPAPTTTPPARPAVSTTIEAPFLATSRAGG